MSFSPYFTDEDLENSIRLQFKAEEQWDMDFNTIFNMIIDRGIDYYLEFRGRKFSIDKITAGITDLSNVEEEDDYEEE